MVGTYIPNYMPLVKNGLVQKRETGISNKYINVLMTQKTFSGKNFPRKMMGRRKSGI
jgi:hypothetical protein